MTYHHTPDLTPEDVAYMDALLLKKGRLILHSYHFYEQFPKEHLRVWCHLRARYLLPTIELVDWLTDFIAGRSALEIGAGNGDLYWHLGIKGTDSALQTRPEIIAYYNTLALPPTVPPPDVEHINANDAVEKYKPQVVLGAWITHKFNGRNGNMYGPEEERFLLTAEHYVMIGNTRVHAGKPLFKSPHYASAWPWLVSRALDRSLDRIFVWAGNNAPKTCPKCGASQMGRSQRCLNGHVFLRPDGSTRDPDHISEGGSP